MAFSLALPWSPGEVAVHRLLHVPDDDNPTSSFLTPYAATMLQKAPLLAIGTLDAQSRPWTTIWGGAPGLSAPLGSSMIGIRTAVERKYDPVVEALTKGRDDGEVVREEGKGRMVSGLTIDLVNRRRVKLFGRLVAGALSRQTEEEDGVAQEGDEEKGEVQLVVRIEQSLGNCPKYLNRKEIRPALLSPKLLSNSPCLSQEAISLLHRADLFFISSSNSDYDMDTNHRGGPPGFVRVLSNDESGAELVYPEYSGNRLYQTLGNLQMTPLAGLVFPDFATGDVLYVTGMTEILIGDAASGTLPRSNLAVKIKISEARYVQQGLPFRGTPGEFSPYNPNVRLLAKEGGLAAGSSSASNTVKLIARTQITPTISRYRFAMTNPIPYKAGQWVAMDFSNDLDIGYSHMRDDDPRSLNDDFVRTFTISSPPDEVPPDEFEITIRKVGTVTTYLSQQNPRSGFEIALRGFGGDFRIEPPKPGEIIPFIASGVGITPLLGQLPSLALQKLRLLWTLRIDDVNLVTDTLKNHPSLATSINVFFTGIKQDLSDEQEKAVKAIEKTGARVERRRILEQDLDIPGVSTWYLCASQDLRKILLGWLKDRTVVFENFDY